VQPALDAGFRAVKLHETQLPSVRAGREAAGPEVEVMLDVNCSWTLTQARARADELRPFDLKWLEEPVWPPENFDGLAALRSSGGIALAAGENVSTLMDFERLLAARAVDFVQPSPAKMGGISELQKVFTAASLHNTAVAPHTFYDGPGLLAGIHVTAARGTADSMIEWRYFDLEANVYDGRLAPKDGRLPTPQAPGLELDPDPDVIRRYLRA
jgi:L-alanine-DL-glutamate epimerase-like enolase superfamily enzyme